MEGADAGRSQLRRLLGPLPEGLGAPEGRLLEIQEHSTFTLEHLLLQLNDREPVPACFTRPRGARPPFPTVLFSHSHGVGKDEFLRGAPYLHPIPWAQTLAEQGIAGMAIDAWNFGERRGRTESELFKELLWRGEVLWGLMMFDALRALEYLRGRPDVDPGRIGALGMSMGSTTSWWAAALDPGVRVCVDICCLTDFASLIRHRGLDGHGIYYYVPGLLRHFDTAAINALISPRPHLALAGDFDPLTPPDGLEVIDARLREVYHAAGAPQAWRLSRHAVGHVETRAMRQEARAFLAEWL